MKSSIIDVPRKHTQDDLFGIQVYQDALIEYIKLTDTPITIALQGEWGSGKTSLMNLLRYNLCDVDNAPYFPIWINTWQYSLMKTPAQAIMSILEGIINQIGALNPNEHKWAESKKKIGGLFKKMAIAGTKAAVGAVGIDSGLVDEVLDTEELCANLCLFLAEKYPDRLKERYKVELEEGLTGFEVLEKISRKRGFILKGNEVDLLRGANVVLDEFRGAKLGKITLEQVN